MKLGLRDVRRVTAADLLTPEVLPQNNSGRYLSKAQGVTRNVVQLLKRMSQTLQAGVVRISTRDQLWAFIRDAQRSYDDLYDQIEQLRKIEAEWEQDEINQEGNRQPVPTNSRGR